MPDSITAEGLVVKDLTEIRADLSDGWRAIYGDDINLDQNSPDGQMIGIFAQCCADIRELIVRVNNNFDPDRAIGRILDQRVGYNNIQRRGGTYTLQPISITVDRPLTLAGLDAAANDINGQGFTVSDDAGSEFILVDSITLTPGTYSLLFRARLIGQVETISNTITNAVTIVLGVTNINNPLAPLQVGQKQETDAQLKVRRQKSVALASTGYLNGLEGDVMNLDGVTDAKLHENVGDTADANGIPAHGFWLIVEGGANSEIAETIYGNKSYGSNSKGAVVVNIPTPSGDIFTARFDRPVAAPLYIRFDIARTVTGAVFDSISVKQGITDRLTYQIGQIAETSSVTGAARSAIDAAGGGGVPVNVEISSDGVTYVDFLASPTLASKWNVDPSRISYTVL